MLARKLTKQHTLNNMKHLQVLCPKDRNSSFINLYWITNWPRILRFADFYYLEKKRLNFKIWSHGGDKF